MCPPLPLATTPLSALVPSHQPGGQVCDPNNTCSHCRLITVLTKDHTVAWMGEISCPHRPSDTTYPHTWHPVLVDSVSQHIPACLHFQVKGFPYFNRSISLEEATTSSHNYFFTCVEVYIRLQWSQRIRDTYLQQRNSVTSSHWLKEVEIQEWPDKEFKIIVLQMLYLRTQINYLIILGKWDKNKMRSSTKGWKYEEKPNRNLGAKVYSDWTEEFKRELQQ